MHFRQCQRGLALEFSEFALPLVVELRQFALEFLLFYSRITESLK